MHSRMLKMGLIVSAGVGLFLVLAHGSGTQDAACAAGGCVCPVPEGWEALDGEEEECQQISFNCKYLHCVIKNQTTWQLYLAECKSRPWNPYRNPLRIPHIPTPWVEESSS